MNLKYMTLSHEAISELFRFVLDFPGKKDYVVCVNEEGQEVCISNQETGASRLIHTHKAENTNEQAQDRP